MVFLLNTGFRLRNQVSKLGMTATPKACFKMGFKTELKFLCWEHKIMEGPFLWKQFAFGCGYQKGLVYVKAPFRCSITFPKTVTKIKDNFLVDAEDNENESSTKTVVNTETLANIAPWDTHRLMGMTSQCDGNQSLGQSTMSRDLMHQDKVHYKTTAKD